MSSISWFRLPRGRVWHVALGARALCGAMLPGMGGEWQRNLPPMRARVCSECVDADLRLRDNITQALDRGDLPLPMGDDEVVDAEIVEDDGGVLLRVPALPGEFRRDRLDEFDTNGVLVLDEAQLISFGPSSGESPFPFAGISIVNGTVTGSIEVDDVDGKLAARIRGGNVEGVSIPDVDPGDDWHNGPYAGFNSEGDETIDDGRATPTLVAGYDSCDDAESDPDGDPDRSVPETAVVDLVAALRGSVEAAKARREARDQP